MEQFIGDEDDDESDEDENDVSDGQKKRKGAAKPAEHRALFRGNLDDHFRCVCVCGLWFGCAQWTAGS